MGRNRNNKYKNYLKSNRWKEIKQNKLSKDNNCFLCGKKGKNVHHKHYPKTLGEEELNDLVVLCDFCVDKFNKLRSLNAKIKKSEMLPNIIIISGRKYILLISKLHFDVSCVDCGNIVSFTKRYWCKLNNENICIKCMRSRYQNNQKNKIKYNKAGEII